MYVNSLIADLMAGWAAWFALYVHVAVCTSPLFRQYNLIDYLKIYIYIAFMGHPLKVNFIADRLSPFGSTGFIDELN